MSEDLDKLTVSELNDLAEKLNADKFDFFKCEKTITVGIAMSNFYKFIKTL